MAYISLFRKYRSEDFDDLIGQDHIVKTISNSIKSGKIAQGYLFCGTRGTGKTTVARIIAKALNCIEGPTEHPCGKCSICKSIKEGSCMDVVEMDAASNRSVEDVEKIVESVKYRPVECRYKVYIIDEAHQLSNQAKDAFLKTLEEPPEYVVFILATTEAHKIPVTIRSRCQQFDFKRGSLEDISNRIKYVAEKEGVFISDEAVNLVARNANGSYRDSLSILEQIISFAGNNITPTEVYNVLGLVEEDVLFNISDSIINGNIKDAFSYGSDLINRGKDIKEVLNNIASFYRDLLTVKINAQDLGVQYKTEANKYTEKQLMDIINVFVNAQKDLRLSDQQRLSFELAFINAIEMLKVISAPREVIIEKQIIKEVSKQNNESEAPRKVIQNNNPSVQIKEEAKKQPQRKIDFDKHIRGFWPKFLEYIARGRKDPQLSSCLGYGVPTSYEDSVLTITFKHDCEFQLDACKNHLKNLEEALLECYKTPINVNFKLFAAPVIEEVEEEEIKTPAPDFSQGAEIIQNNIEEDANPVIQRDLHEIQNVTIENSALKNLDSENSNINELEPIFNEKKSDLDTEKELKSDDVLSDSPLSEEKYNEHPLYEQVRSVFPNSTEDIIER